MIDVVALPRGSWAIFDTVTDRFVEDDDGTHSFGELADINRALVSLGREPRHSLPAHPDCNYDAGTVTNGVWRP